MCLGAVQVGMVVWEGFRHFSVALVSWFCFQHIPELEMTVEVTALALVSLPAGVIWITSTMGRQAAWAGVFPH